MYSALSSVRPLIFAEPACASVDRAYVDDGGYALAGARDHRGADGLAEPRDDTTHEARSDNGEFADVVDFQCWLPEAHSYGWGEALPGQVAEEAVYAGGAVRLALRCAASRSWEWQPR